MVILPAVCGVFLLLLRKSRVLQLVVSMASAGLNLIFAIGLYAGGEFFTEIPLAPFGFSYTMRVYDLSSLFLVFTGAVFLLIAWYTVLNLRESGYSGLYLLYLFLSFAMVNGAMLSDNLGLMLFFWEGMLALLFGMLLLGKKANPKTAFKAAATSGLAVLLLMLGIIVTAHMAETSAMSKIEELPVSGTCLFGFLTIMLGALGKCSCMPFHSWTIDAADDSPAVFNAAIPGALEKILGIYFAVRIVLNIYDFVPGSGVSIAVMTLGTITAVLAGAMALIQKDMKRLLAYVSLSQLGLMVLGIGSGLPDGIIGGSFLLLNYAVYQTGLFMISGYIEKQTGTADMGQLGGLRKKMPVTACVYIVCALSAVCFPGLSGFLAGGLIVESALESGLIFYILSLSGIFLTALALLKMGRAVFFGEQKLPDGIRDVHESKSGMLIPAGILSIACIALGVGGPFPLNDLLVPSLGYTGAFTVWPQYIVTAAVFIIVLALAVCENMYGTRKAGSALQAADHIRNAPVIRSIYGAAEKGRLDPFNWMMTAVCIFSDFCVLIEHGISWIYDTAVPNLVKSAGTALHRFDNGSLPRYLSLAVGGVAVITIIFLLVLLGMF